MVLAFIFIAALLLRIPISIVLGITSIAYIFIIGDFRLLLPATQRLFYGLESFSILAIPLFMFAGELMNSGGITKRIINFAKVLVGHYRGGLSYVNVIANMFLASIIGSATAQIAIMSKIMVPAMEDEGYSREYSAATTSIAALLGPIIPPSMTFIIYGASSGVSIGGMFLAGIIPGVLLAVSIVCIIIFLGHQHQPQKTLEKATFKKILSASFQIIPALLVPGIIVWGILSGAFTPTESAAIACLLGLVVGIFFYRELKIKDLPKIMVNTAITTATVTLLIAMANLFGWILALERVPQVIAQWMSSLTDSALVFLLLTNVFLLLVGLVLDGIAALIILVPVFMPLVNAYGIDPIHFGVIICINLTIGLLTPPVGAGLFIASSIGQVKMESLTKVLMPFLLAAIFILVVLTVFPQLVIWLPYSVN